MKTEWDAADEDVKATRKVAKPKLRMLHVMKVQEEEKAGKKAAKKTVKPNADWERNWHLVDGNFNETIKGTAAFIFFYRETCVLLCILICCPVMTACVRRHFHTCIHSTRHISTRQVRRVHGAHARLEKSRHRICRLGHCSDRRRRVRRDGG